MKYLGLDWGMKRIGLAVSEGMIASPFRSLTVSSLNQAVDQIVKIIKDEEIDKVIIGKPEGEVGKIVEKVFKEFLKKGIDLEMVDETLSTKHAQSEMILMGVPQAKRSDDNGWAAAIILQQFLDLENEKKTK